MEKLQDFYEKTIYEWVKNNFGESEADDPSWNISMLAEELASKYTETMGIIVDIQKDYTMTLDPADFGEQQDAMFHYEESYTLAEGKGWRCVLNNSGEQVLRAGKLWNEDVLEKYDSDTKLHRAINTGKVEVINHSWWELDFFKGDDYVDLHIDTYCTSVEEAIEKFKEIADKLKLIEKEDE